MVIENGRYQILSFSGTRFFSIGRLSFLFILKFDFASNTAIPITPGKVNIRSKLLRIGLFKYLYDLFIVGVSSASQSMVWAVEEMKTIELRAFLLDFSYEKVWHIEKKKEPIMASTK